MNRNTSTMFPAILFFLSRRGTVASCVPLAKTSCRLTSAAPMYESLRMEFAFHTSTFTAVSCPCKVKFNRSFQRGRVPPSLHVLVRSLCSPTLRTQYGSCLPNVCVSFRRMPSRTFTSSRPAGMAGGRREDERARQELKETLGKGFLCGSVTRAACQLAKCLLLLRKAVRTPTTRESSLGQRREKRMSTPPRGRET